MKIQKLLTIISISSTILLVGCSSVVTVPATEIPEDIQTKLQNTISQQELILKEDPENTEAMITIGLNYQLLEDFDSAEKQYLKVLEISPNNIVALNNIADVYEQKENYEKAAEYITKLHQLTPANTEAIRDTVRILLKANRPDDAETALKNYMQSVERTPENNTQISNLYQSIYDYPQTN